MSDARSSSDAMSDAPTPSSTSSAYSHLEFGGGTPLSRHAHLATPGSSVISLPRHLSTSTTSASSSGSGGFNYRGTPEFSFAQRSPSSHGDRPPSSVGSSSRTLPPPSPTSLQPFVPTVDFDALGRSNFSPTAHQHHQPIFFPTLRAASPLPPSLSGSTTFQPDFFPSANLLPDEPSPTKLQAKFDAMDELMEATLTQPTVLPSVQATPGSSTRSMRMNSGGGGGGGGGPLYLSRSRFAHLGAASVASPLVPVGLLVRRALSKDESIADLADPIASFDSASQQHSPSFTHESSPIQTVRRIGGARQLVSRRTTFNGGLESPGPGRPSSLRALSMGIQHQQQQQQQQYPQHHLAESELPQESPSLGMRSLTLGPRS